MQNVKQKSIKKNFLWNMSLRALNILFPLITFPFIARVLSPEGVGKVEFSLSVIQYFILISQIGIPMYAIRECAKFRDDKDKLAKTAQEILFINLIMVVVSYIIFSTVIFTIDSFAGYKTLLIILSINILSTSIGLEWFYQAIEEYRLITIRNFFVKLLSLILVFLLIRQESDYILYGMITVFSISIGYLYNFIQVNKHINLFNKYSDYDLKRHIRPILVLFAMSLSISIYANLDKVMLGLITNNEAVGLYTAASKMVKLSLTVITSLGVVLLPRMSYCIENNQIEEVKRLIKKSIDFILMTSIPATIGLIMLAKPIILLFAGQTYLEAATTMRIISPIIIAIGLSNLIGIQILISHGKEKLTVISTIIGAIVNLVLNFFLISKFMQDGAALATLIAEVIVLGVQLYFARTYIKGNINYRNVSIYLFGGVLISITCLLIVYLITPLILETFLSVVFSVFIYFTTLYLFKNQLVYGMSNKFLNKLWKK